MTVEADGSSMASVLSLPEGMFVGDAKHKDGSLMAVVFQVGACRCKCLFGKCACMLMNPASWKR